MQGIVLLDKPVGISSNDALQKIKRLYDARKAGHRIDPSAGRALYPRVTALVGRPRAGDPLELLLRRVLVDLPEGDLLVLPFAIGGHVEIEHDPALARVQEEEGPTLLRVRPVVGEGAPAPRDVARARRLDLDHVRAVVREEA